MIHACWSQNTDTLNQALSLGLHRVLYEQRAGNTRGVAIFAKAFMGLPAQQAAKTTRPLMPAAAPAVLLLSLDTQQGVSNIILAMTRRDVGKPAFSLRKKRFVKTHTLSLLGTTRLLFRSGGGRVTLDSVMPQCKNRTRVSIGQLSGSKRYFILFFSFIPLCVTPLITCP